MKNFSKLEIRYLGGTVEKAEQELQNYLSELKKRTPYNPKSREWAIKAGQRAKAIKTTIEKAGGVFKDYLKKYSRKDRTLIQESYSFYDTNNPAEACNFDKVCKDSIVKLELLEQALDYHFSENGSFYQITMVGESVFNEMSALLQRLNYRLKVILEDYQKCCERASEMDGTDDGIEGLEDI